MICTDTLTARQRTLQNGHKGQNIQQGRISIFTISFCVPSLIRGPHVPLPDETYKSEPFAENKP